MPEEHHCILALLLLGNFTKQKGTKEGKREARENEEVEVEGYLKGHMKTIRYQGRPQSSLNALKCPVTNTNILYILILNNHCLQIKPESLFACL